MSFFSTRGGACVTASQSILWGLAADGGLYVPSLFPQISSERLAALCGQSYRQRAARILRDFEKYSNKEFKNALTDLAGRTMIPVLVRLSGIPEDTKVNAITHEQRMRLLHLFKAFPVSVTGTRPIDEAIVTAGGVSTKEVNPRTMESKLMPGLYFAGEVLDLDGYTGGFNLQIAWSTGYVAGNSI